MESRVTIDRDEGGVRFSTGSCVNTTGPIGWKRKPIPRVCARRTASSSTRPSIPILLIPSGRFFSFSLPPLPPLPPLTPVSGFLGFRVFQFYKSFLLRILFRERFHRRTNRFVHLYRVALVIERRSVAFNVFQLRT